MTVSTALMFPQEVEYIWRRKITLPLVFYLILRYFSPGLGVFLLASKCILYEIQFPHAHLFYYSQLQAELITCRVYKCLYSL